MNGKPLLLALAVALAVAAGCHSCRDADHRTAHLRFVRAIAECDSIISACVDTLSRENILMIEYRLQADCISQMHDAYVTKERLLEEHIIDSSEGDMKLFLYQEFERGHRLYDAWAEQNDSLVYATSPLSAPWIESRCQRINKLAEHIKILERRTRQPF